MNQHEPKAKRWRDFVSVGPRYQRSVHLERDAPENGALDGYILTPLVRTLTNRVAAGLASPSSTRAWSITGPYGTGKSAFALFLADVFSPSHADATRSARHLLAKADPALSRAIIGPHAVFTVDDGLCPVLATGERRSLNQVLLRGLLGATERFWAGPGAKPSIIRQVAQLAARAAAGRPVPAHDVVALFERVAEAVSKSKLPGRGLLIVLDEAGKVLEHAAQSPENGDVQLLQELAEAAHRSREVPLVFVVLLHQSFEQYAGWLSLTERTEWAKIQGRFEDLAFQEASHELLGLVGQALEHQALPKPVQLALDGLVSSCTALVAGGANQDLKRLEAMLTSTLPLHPFTAMLLGPLFRSRIAQNERSLFAFLSSTEPCGFQEFLDQHIAEAGSPVLFLPDALYDYVVASLGARIQGHLGKQWAQVETALRRLPEGAGRLEARLLKTVGLLGCFGDAAGISASEATLRLLFATEDESSSHAVENALDRLRRASLLVFRKYRDAFQLIAFDRPQARRRSPTKRAGKRRVGRSRSAAAAVAFSKESTRRVVYGKRGAPGR